MKLKTRIEIEIRLRENKKIREMAKFLNISHTTISREIFKNKKVVRNKKNLELNYINDEDVIKTHPCSLLKHSPYVCNGCPRYINNHCNYHYVLYEANDADLNYHNLKSKSNSKMIKEELKKEIIKYIQKGLILGQPLSHIHSYLTDKYKDDMVSITTIYKWIDKGILNYTKNKIKRKKDNEANDKIEYKRRIDYLKDKEYEDFLEYTRGKNINIVEIDLICGKQGTNGYIMTLFIPRIQFLLAYKLEYKTPFEVVKVLDHIESRIGYSTFKKMFGLILTDRGTEFLKYKEIELSKKYLKQRTKIFYCDAGKPTQKSYIENIHKLLRRVYKKGTSLECVTQEDLYEVISNINSLKKKKYKNKTPNEMFKQTYSKTLLTKLSLREYLSCEVVLI